MKNEAACRNFYFLLSRLEVRSIREVIKKKSRGERKKKGKQMNEATVVVNSQSKHVRRHKFLLTKE